MVRTRSREVARGGGDLARSGADLRGGRSGFGGGGLLLLGGRGDLGDRGGDLHRRTLGLRHQALELFGHAVETGLDGAEFVTPAEVQACGEVATGHQVEAADDLLDRLGDRPQQQEPADAGYHHRQQQGHQHAQFGVVHRVDDVLRGAIGDVLVQLDQLVEVLATVAPVLGQRAGDELAGFFEAFLAIQLEHLVVLLQVGLAHTQEAGEQFVVAGLVRVHGLLVGGDLLVQALLAGKDAVSLGLAQLVVVGDAEQFLGLQVVVGPRTAYQGDEVHPRHGVVLDTVGALFHRQHLHVRSSGHQQHDRDDHGETCQDSLANSPVLHIFPQDSSPDSFLPPQRPVNRADCIGRPRHRQAAP